VTNPNLPRALALQSGVGLQVVDYQVITLAGVADAHGTITMFPSDEVDGGQLWRVERITVTPNISGGKTVQCGVYGGTPGPSTIRDWVDLSTGTIGIAEYPQPMTIESATLLTIQILGATAGDLAAAVVQYAVVQRAAGS
jgi:hypothetical protein